MKKGLLKIIGISSACILISLLATSFFGCGEEKEEKARGPLVDVYRDMFEEIYNHLMNDVPVVDGDVETDFGDSNAWAPALFYSLKKEGIATEKELNLAREMVEREIRLIESLSEGLLESLDDTDKLMEVYIGVAGLFIAYEATGNESYKVAIEEYLDAFKPWAHDSIEALLLLNLQTDTPYGSIPPYGATTVLGGIAGFYLQYYFSVGDSEKASYYAGIGTDILSSLDELVYDTDSNNYRYSIDAENDFIYLYSNVTTFQGLIRAYFYSGEENYLQRAKEIIETMEELYSEVYGGYFAAEDVSNAPHYGEEYIALSAQNYITYAFLLLYQETGDSKYLDRVENTLSFIETKLYQDGIVYHDLINGVRADWDCPGCNYQVLYYIYLYDRLLKGKAIIE
ncbi:MAG: hypothetical protein JSU92_06555 [Deltaproteobacteria bacterium]|nr:MAG: hypothetical protein JSU92_06555 [Deltaproteobacteria bacterium]